MSEAGPVEYIIVAFPGNKFSGEIMPALADLVDSQTIRVIDLAFVAKDAEGNVAGFELSDLDPDVQAALEQMGAEETGLFNEDDLMAAGEALEPESSAALLVWEDLWAAPFVEAVRNADGVLVDHQRIPAEIVQAARDWAAANA
jgi:hypothetical protein